MRQAHLQFYLIFFSWLLVIGCTINPGHIDDGFLGGIYLSPSQSVITVSQNTLIAGSSITVTLTAKDQNGAKYIPNSSLPVTVQFTQSGGTSRGTFGSVTDNLDGTFSALFTGTTAGTATTISAIVNGKNLESLSPEVSVFSGLGSFSISSAVPNATDSATGTVTISFGTSIGATAYTLKYGTSTGSYSTVVSTSATSPYTVTGLAAGTTYYFMVTATNSSGSLNASAEVSQAPQRTFALNIPFTTATESSYSISDTNKVELVSNLVRLKAADQVDDDNTATGFTGSTMTGVQWDTSNNYLRLNTSTNNAELDSSWTPQWSSLVGYWKLNGTVGTIANGSTVDGVVGGNATFSNANNSTSPITGYTTGQSNQSTQFDGFDDSIVLSNLISIPAGSPITVAFWNYVTTANVQNSGAFTIGGSETPNRIMAHAPWGDGNLYWDYGNPTSGSGRIFVSYTPYLNRWTHVVLVSNGSSGNYQAIYLNGQLIASQNASVGAATTLTGGYIGRFQSASYHKGAIDDFAVWTSALTSTQIQTIYARQSAKYSGLAQSRVMDAYSAQSWTSVSSFSTLPFYKELPGSSGSESSAAYSSVSASLMSGLLGYWKMNETSWNGTLGEVIDSSGNGKSGYRTGSANTTNLSGKFNSSGSFAAATDSVVTTASSGYIQNPNSPLTVGVWIYPTTIGSGTVANSIISFHRGSTEGSSLRFGLGSSNKLMYYNHGDFTNTSSSSTININTWSYVALAYNGICFQMYINGFAEGSCLSKTLVAGGSFNVRIGSYASASYNFIGNLDEVAIWNRALSAAEILQLYRRGANRLKYQVRSCSASDCSDQEAITVGKGWKGPDNTSQSYFSELYNTTSNILGGTVSTGSPTMTFGNFSGSGLSVAANRYFQYRTILESDDQNNLCNYGAGAVACSPELKSVTAGPNHYDIAVHTITSSSTIGSSYQTLDASGFTSTLGSNSCSQGAKYSLSRDGIIFYYWNGSAWTVSSSTYATASTAADITANISSFPSTIGTGTLQVTTFLKSDGTSPCEVDNLLLTGKKY